MIIHTGSMDTIKSHGKEKKTKRHIQSKARRDAAKEFKRLRKLQVNPVASNKVHPWSGVSFIFLQGLLVIELNLQIQVYQAIWFVHIL